MLSAAKARLLGRLARPRQREREGRFLVEGVRAVEEVLDSSLDVVFAVISPALRRTERGRALRQALDSAGVALTEVPDSELVALSATESPQGIVLVCEEPRTTLADLGAQSGSFLVLDGIQDPGNAGTLIRTGRAFGLAGVVCLDGTVDPWNPKAVRAGAGAGTRIPVVRARWRDFAAWSGDLSLPVLVADARGADVERTDPGSRWALVVGSEGDGPRPEAFEVASGRVAVPMRGGAESLNAAVAGAILLYALTRRIPDGGRS